MSAIETLLQALRSAVAVVDSSPDANNIQLTLALNNIQECANSIFATVSSLTSEEWGNVIYELSDIVLPLRANKTQLDMMSTDQKAYFGMKMDNPEAFENLRSSFLSHDRCDRLTDHTIEVARKVFLSISDQELSRRYLNFNIPIHSNNFVSGLVRGGARAPTDRQKHRVLTLLDGYIRSKHLSAIQRYQADPEVASLRARINKYSETITSITNVTVKIVQLRYEAQVTKCDPVYHKPKLVFSSGVDTGHWAYNGAENLS
jgi:hypothetical protein